MGSGQDRPLVFVGDSITAGWGACRAETEAPMPAAIAPDLAPDEEPGR